MEFPKATTQETRSQFFWTISTSCASFPTMPSGTYVGAQNIAIVMFISSVCFFKSVFAYNFLFKMG